MDRWIFSFLFLSPLISKTSSNVLDNNKHLIVFHIPENTLITFTSFTFAIFLLHRALHRQNESCKCPQFSRVHILFVCVAHNSNCMLCSLDHYFGLKIISFKKYDQEISNCARVWLCVTFAKCRKKTQICSENSLRFS